jgi:hypothetical protein
MIAIQHHDRLPVAHGSVSEAQDANYLYNGLPRFWADDVYVLIYTSHDLELMKATCRLGSLSLLSMMKVMMV